MVNFVNLTPHSLKLILEDGEVMEIIPSGIIARVEMEEVKENMIEGIPVKILKKSKIINLPEKREGVIYVASAMVAEAANRAGRLDVVAPDTGAAIRNEEGHIIGVPGLVQYMP